MKAIVYLLATGLDVRMALSENEYPEVEKIFAIGVRNEKGLELSRVTIVDEDYEKIVFCARHLASVYGLESAVLELHDCDEIVEEPISLVTLNLAKGAEITVPEGVKCYTSFTTFYPIMFIREEPDNVNWLDLVEDMSDSEEVEKITTDTVRLVNL